MLSTEDVTLIPSKVATYLLVGPDDDENLDDEWEDEFEDEDDEDEVEWDEEDLSDLDDDETE
ncbi:MAG TPA: hypothetical protein VFW76_04845 [Ktedonobacterales bacterium]|nr:hypothetical protein [Ktedonobacterales bacterium]